MSENPVQRLPWQAVDLAKLGVSENLAKDAVVLVRRDDPVVLSGVEAAAGWLGESKRLRWRLLGKVLGLWALRPVAERLYRVVVRNRNRIPGPWQGSHRRS
jgi:predicted DCC family thiol-disulfide oxidoreductase YuxK